MTATEPPSCDDDERESSSLRTAKGDSKKANTRKSKSNKKAEKRVTKEKAKRHEMIRVGRGRRSFLLQS